MGVVRQLDRAVLTGRTHGKLVHVQLAGHHRSGGVEPLDDGGVIRRFKIIEHLGGAGGQDALGADIILDGDRYAGERGKLLPLGAAAVNSGGLFQSVFGTDSDVSSDLPVGFLDSAEHRTGQLNRTDLAPGEHGGKFGCGLLIKHSCSPPYSTILGTTTQPAST